jgi:hypothetical protein
MKPEKMNTEGNPTAFQPDGRTDGYTRGEKEVEGVREEYDRNKRDATEGLGRRFTGYAVYEIRGRRAFQMRMTQIGGEENNPAWEQP